jgi:hypothetical protein
MQVVTYCVGLKEHASAVCPYCNCATCSDATLLQQSKLCIPQQCLHSLLLLLLLLLLLQGYQAQECAV